MNDQTKRKCPHCGNILTDLTQVRCPRCNQITVNLSCEGSCKKCKEKNNCGCEDK